MAKSFKRENNNTKKENDNTQKENNKSGKPTKPIIVASNWFEYIFRKWSSKHHFIENNKSGKTTRTIIVASNWHRYFRECLPDHSEEEINLLVTKDFLGGLRFKWFKTEEVEI